MARTESKLRTMTQTRLESLMFAAVENDITKALKDENLVAIFAKGRDGRMLLG